MIKWSKDNFRKAAVKHYNACVFLRNKIESETNKNNIKDVTSDFYYLSGYILECILKYSIMEGKHLEHSYSLEDLEKFGLKTHNLNHLFILATEHISITDVKISSKISIHWNEQIRYVTNILDIKDKSLVIEHFDEYVKPIFTEVLKKF